MRRNLSIYATFLLQEIIMPMLFWFPVIIIREMWSIALAEMPFATRRPATILKDVTSKPRRPDTE